ncbi:MAG: DNA/RNA non-specific endonuclease [Thermodesulfobacteriota bacterium]|jgi:endonuclease G
MFAKRRIALIVILSIILSVAFGFAGPIEDCAEYAKLGVPGNQGDLLCRKGHLLAHDPEKKTPIWVIEHLTAERAEGTLPRNNTFRADPDLEKGKRAELPDYKGSKEYDRGHMAPAADMRWDKEAMKECFYLSNMVPQNKGMNRGIWKSLEEYIRDWAIDRDEIYIFTGPIGVRKTIGKNKVAVPTHLYKIIYDPNKREAIAFIMPNRELNTKDMPKYIVTIRDVEGKTGLDFLSSLDKELQDKIETKKEDGLWK